ncbi:MAG: 4Fe-4S binding protein [Elusimicrobiota bacterium]
MATLETEFLGFKLENPYILASAPPTKDYAAIKKAFVAGWAGAITKSIGPEPYIDVMPRIAHIKQGGRIIATQNIEMGTIYTIEEWVDIINRLKDEHPEKLVYASIIAADKEDDWRRLAAKLIDTQIDGLELNFSCPHLTHKGEGAVVGESPELAGKIVGWVRSEVGKDVKIMPKLTYAAGLRIGNVARQCVDNGADAIVAINTILGLCEIDINTLKPKLAVDGKTAYSGMSAGGMRPLARYAVAEIAKAVDFRKFPISATGGIADLESSVEYLALGANNLQVCSAVMNRGLDKGYEIVKKLKDDLLAYMDRQGFATLEDFRGKTLENVVPYTDLDTKMSVVSLTVESMCTCCGLCEVVCMYSGVTVKRKEKTVEIDTSKCDGCGSCAAVCPTVALSMELSS